MLRQRLQWAADPVRGQPGCLGGIRQGCPRTGSLPHLDKCLMKISARIAQTSCTAGVTAQSLARRLPGDIC